MFSALRRTLAAACCSALPLTLNACGGGHSKDADGAEEALADYFSALADGDDEACDMETKRYREEANDSWEEGIGCPERVRQTKAFLEAFDVDLDKAEYDAEVHGNKAIVH